MNANDDGRGRVCHSCGRRFFLNQPVCVRMDCDRQCDGGPTGSRYGMTCNPEYSFPGTKYCGHCQEQAPNGAWLNRHRLNINNDVDIAPDVVSDDYEDAFSSEFDGDNFDYSQNNVFGSGNSHLKDRVNNGGRIVVSKERSLWNQVDSESAQWNPDIRNADTRIGPNVKHCSGVVYNGKRGHRDFYDWEERLFPSYWDAKAARTDSRYLKPSHTPLVFPSCFLYVGSPYIGNEWFGKLLESVHIDCGERRETIQEPSELRISPYVSDHNAHLFHWKEWELPEPGTLVRTPHGVYPARGFVPKYDSKALDPATLYRNRQHLKFKSKRPRVFSPYDAVQQLWEIKGKAPNAWKDVNAHLVQYRQDLKPDKRLNRLPFKRWWNSPDRDDLPLATNPPKSDYEPRNWVNVPHKYLDRSRGDYLPGRTSSTISRVKGIKSEGYSFQIHIPGKQINLVLARKSILKLHPLPDEASVSERVYLPQYDAIEYLTWIVAPNDCRRQWPAYDGGNQQVYEWHRAGQHCWFTGGNHLHIVKGHDCDADLGNFPKPRFYPFNYVEEEYDLKNAKKIVLPAIMVKVHLPAFFRKSPIPFSYIFLEEKLIHSKGCTYLVYEDGCLVPENWYWWIEEERGFVEDNYYELIGEFAYW